LTAWLARNCSRVQVLSNASFSGFANRRDLLEPDRRVERAHGGVADVGLDETRRVAGSSKRSS